VSRVIFLLSQPSMSWLTPPVMNSVGQRGCNVVAAAMIDRLVHHAEARTLPGDSYRTRAAANCSPKTAAPTDKKRINECPPARQAANCFSL
jgi:hypothetical protein